MATELNDSGIATASRHLLTHDDAEVEADVIRTLYGDPSSRHRAYATCGHDQGAGTRERALDAAIGDVAPQTVTADVDRLHEIARNDLSQRTSGSR